MPYRHIAAKYTKNNIFVLQILPAIFEICVSPPASLLIMFKETLKRYAEVRKIKNLLSGNSGNHIYPAKTNLALQAVRYDIAQKSPCNTEAGKNLQ